MNTITLHGNCVRAEIKTAESGKNYLVATIASDRSTNREHEAGTDFFRVVQFDVNELPFEKGQFVKIDGSVRLSSFGEDKRLSCEIVARKIERPVRKEKAA